MASIKTVLNQTIGKLFFHDLALAEARQVSPHFRHLTLEGAPLRTAPLQAGDKLQVLAGDAPRTYSPFSLDRARGTVDLLVYSHGDGPGSQWGKTVALGDRMLAFGPRSSLPLTKLEGPVVLIGDETSFAVALALREHRGDEAMLVVEANDPAESRQVLEAMALSKAAVVARAANDAHLDALEDRVREGLGREPNATLVLTGRAQTIQALRARLKARPAPHRAQKVKAYWSVGKRGLD